ncbi:unnamed protein product, partial [Strongylus vulgaris]
VNQLFSAVGYSSTHCVTDICPEGRAIFRAKETSLPRRCLMNVPRECAEGFSCQSRIRGATQGFCCVCKDNARFLLDDGTKMPKICSHGLFSNCPPGYSCQLRMPLLSSGFCCKVSGNVVTASQRIVEGCPPGEYALTRDDKIVDCDPFSSKSSCPLTFSCQYAVAFRRYQCCGTQPPEEQEKIQRENGCPPSQVAFLEGNRPLMCTSTGDNCPFGYFCQFSDKNKHFQCCGHKAGEEGLSLSTKMLNKSTMARCPRDSVAFLDLTGNAMTCSKGGKTCPDGYSCQMVEHGGYVCCTSDTINTDSMRERGNQTVSI